jgi:excisionase family DNA binding protein
MSRRAHSPRPTPRRSRSLPNKQSSVVDQPAAPPSSNANRRKARAPQPEDPPLTEPPVTSRLLSVSTVARLLDVHPRTVRGWIAVGRLPAMRVGPRLWKIRRDTLKRLL